MAGWTSVQWCRRRKDKSGRSPKVEEIHHERAQQGKNEEKPDESQTDEQGRPVDEQEADVEREADPTNERREVEGKKIDTTGEAEGRGVTNQSKNDSTTQIATHGMLKRLRNRGRNALGSVV